MDISRQQFEECIKLHSDQTELEHKLRKAHNGINYLDPVIDLMWISWQNSRDAMKPVAFTIQDDAGYLYLNRMTTQEGGELNHQLNLLQKYCPEKQYSITTLYRLDK
ncbi:TPA: hypothetical protein ON737_001350 [Morganella morganii]|nr:hypothetical protein [Morganella morganii]HCR3760373.1 hypothetical protein [Morganella morganii]HCT5325206.1 hypothetical protein [Morganella morganii]